MAWALWLAACSGTGGGALGTDASAPDAGSLDATISDAAMHEPDSATEPTTVHLLFIGNSYTGVNDLPGTLARLADAPDSSVRFEVESHTPGGQTWEGHDADPAVDALIARGWDYVVLQDQSQQPWWGPPTDVKPALLSLNAKIRAASAETVLYMTWARQDGGLYQDMLVDSYYEFGAEATDARVAPVGRAWERALRDPMRTLHAGDGSHPTPSGTYLAACVFYATLTERSPVGLGTAGLGVAEAERAELQHVAWDAYLAESRPAPPELGAWPLSAADAGDDIIPGGELSFGDVSGPDGGLATTFSPTAFAGVPYFAGLNTAELTLSVDASRPDWSVPTDHREYLVSRDVSYELYLEGDVLTAKVFTDPEPPSGPPPAIPVMPDPEPPSIDISFAVDALAPGWHRIALTHNGLTEELWVDGAQVASAPGDGTIGCSETGPGCNTGIALGVESEAVDGAAAPRFAFSGDLAHVHLLETALTAAEIQAL